MKTIVLALAVFGLLLANPAAAAKAQKKQHVRAALQRIKPYPPRDPYAVYTAGAYVGSDPDPTIRAQLIREFYSPGGND
jgi:hypothetical protein